MADKYGPIFCIHLGLRKALVVGNWEVAKECYTTNYKVFATRPRSLAVKLMGYDHAMFGFAPYGPYWRDVQKLAMVELLSNCQLEMLKHVQDSKVEFLIKEIYGMGTKQGKPHFGGDEGKIWELGTERSGESNCWETVFWDPCLW